MLNRSSKKCISLSAYNENIIRALLSMKIVEKAIPELKDEEVLVKIDAATCNPSDIAFLQGSYNIKKALPAVPGFEGSGIVKATGKKARHLLNQRVSCFTQQDEDGTWSDYFVTKHLNCIPISEDLSIEQASTFAINPFTAWGLFEKAKTRHCKTIIVNAAGSQVCNMLRSLAYANNIKVINIVRKEKHTERLKSEGSEFVLWSGDEKFQQNLKSLAHKLSATIAYDAIAGDQSGILLSAMPDNSELIVYGGLSGKAISGIEILDIIFHKKIISGFDLNSYINTKSKEAFTILSKKIQDSFSHDIFRSNVQAVYKIEDFVKGIRQYLGNMSDGKILIKP